MPRHKKILHEQFLKKQDVFRFEEVRKTTKCLRSKKKGHYGRYICIFREKGKLYYALHFTIKSLDLIQVERKFIHVLIKDMIIFTF